jgi:3-methylcrotonyl-CoA carboxylase alpha subunit
MFDTILIANRGEIAVRIMRTARRLGIRCVAVYSDADARSMHVEQADEAHRIGPPPAAESYLDAAAIIAAAKRAGAEAIHPGYGFLSENPGFAEACEAAGLVFIGPPAGAIRAMGLKDAAKRLMVAAGVPVVPGYHGEAQDFARLAEEAEQIGYPVLIKARAGGGGKGMRRVERPQDFAPALESAQREATSSFGDAGVIVERYVSRPRHIEVQVFADAHGNAVHLFERDCSLQRRHQKVIEEAPAPGMTADMRAAMGEAAVKAALAVGYRGAGTVEFIVDASEGLRADRFYFMEMNTRLQVEHPVTEAITGHDLVAWQLRVAAGERFTLRQDQLSIRGHAFEARIYAEDAERNFAPSTGKLTHLELPTKLARVDTGVRAGDEITPYYDPMIAKVIVHGRDRASALRKLSRALEATRASGSVTNISFVAALARHPAFVAGDVDTGLIERELAVLRANEKPDAETIALAAAVACGLVGSGGAASGDPWTSMTGWRQWGPAVLHALLVHGAERIEATVEVRDAKRIAVTSRGETFAFVLRGQAGDGSRVRYEADGVMREADIVAAGAEIAVYVSGFSARFSVPDALGGIEDDATGGDRVMAPIPGLVKVVKASAGQTVAKGDPLMVLEAMKMEHTLTAPRDGRIAEVFAAAGDLVQEGTVLVQLEEGSGD